MRLCHGKKPALEQASGKTCVSTGKEPQAGSAFLAILVTSWEPTLEKSVPEGLHLAEGTHTKAVHEEPHGKNPIGEVHGGLSHLEGRP